MIIGIGIDILEIARFSHWHQRNPKQLLRIFSQKEIDYCLANEKKSAERFAARFAAKEAFYKAASQYFDYNMSFLSTCPQVDIVSPPPKLNVAWHKLPINLIPHQIRTHVSISHSNISTSVVVLLEYTEQQTRLTKKAYQVDNLTKPGNL